MFHVMHIDFSIIFSDLLHTKLCSSKSISVADPAYDWSKMTIFGIKCQTYARADEYWSKNKETPYNQKGKS